MENVFPAPEHQTPSPETAKAERRHSLVGPAALWKIKRDFQIQFLKSAGLAPQSYLFDIGCGTLRGGLPLIDYLQEGHYFGYEVRENVLTEGRMELAEAALGWKNPVLLLAPDISQLEVNQTFDFMWAFSVLIHLQDEILDRTLGFVSRHLGCGGVFYANVNVGDAADGEWQGFPLVWRPLAFYQKSCEKHRLTLTDIGALSAYGHVSNAESQDQQRLLRITQSN